MSGHFVVWDLKVADSSMLHSVFAGNVGHALVDAAPHVWNITTQAELQRVMGGAALANRNNLPSHCYFHINNPTADQCDAARRSGTFETMAARLVRPTMGLTALSIAAQAQWDLGNKEEAFLAQAQHATATIEYYYAAGSHV